MSATGLFALILRDPSKAAGLAAELVARGGRAATAATHKTELVPACGAARTFLSEAQQFAGAVFASPTAVAALIAAARFHRLPLPIDLPCAGPGTSTGAALQAAGVRKITVPPGIGSMTELLAQGLANFFDGRRLALVQRADAKVTTKLALQARGALVLTIPCFRRRAIGSDFWTQTDAAAYREINCIIAYEETALTVLLAQAGKDIGRFRSLPLTVHHRQIATRAKALGFSQITVFDDRNNGPLTTLVKMLAASS